MDRNRGRSFAPQRGAGGHHKTPNSSMVSLCVNRNLPHIFYTKPSGSVVAFEFGTGVHFVLGSRHPFPAPQRQPVSQHNATRTTTPKRLYHQANVASCLVTQT